MDSNYVALEIPYGCRLMVPLNAAPAALQGVFLMKREYNYDTKEVTWSVPEDGAVEFQLVPGDVVTAAKVAARIDYAKSD